ncbi:MAG: nitroreductase family protein [Promethearchaeia archaeon]
MKAKLDDKLKLIKSRKSIRNFVYKEIEEETIKKILECGQWAPSGLNNQPWKVNVVIHPTVKRMLAENTKHGSILESAYVNLVVFLDKEKGYDRVKDIQAIGAFIENLLLGAHAVGLGAVWIGEILNQKESVNEIFKLDPKQFELMGAVAIGHIDDELQKQKEKKRTRRDLDDFIDWF